MCVCMNESGCLMNTEQEEVVKKRILDEKKDDKNKAGRKVKEK